MSIEEILSNKKKQLIEGLHPLAINYTLDEINILNDKDQLTVLRVLGLDSLNFCGLNDVFKCAEFAKSDSSLGGILEYSVLRNPLIRESVSEVFPKFRYASEQ